MQLAVCVVPSVCSVWHTTPPCPALPHPSPQGINPYIRPLARLLGKLTPTAAVVATDKNTLFPNIQVGSALPGLGRRAGIQFLALSSV